MSAPGAPKKPRHVSQTTTAVAQSHYAADDQQVYCIRGAFKNSEEKKYQEETFNMLVEVGIEPLWMDASSAFNVSKNDPHFYVLPSFSGELFEHLEKTQCKVLSTSLIRHCLHKSIAIPKQRHPIYSFHFSKVEVCFTGLFKERRDHLTKLVRYMSGVAHRNLRPSVTHLVTDRGDYQSDKYRAAKTKRLPIIQPEWIEEAWEKALNNTEGDYSKCEIIERFTLPLFNKLVICTSGIGGQERSDLMRLIELNGGRSPGEMRRGECTHLVTEQIVGAKYKKAREWRDVKIVTIRWIRKSVEQGYLQDELKYDPAKPQLIKNSTQLSGAPPAPRDLDVSSIYGPLKHTLNSQVLREHNLTGREIKEGGLTGSPATMPRTQSKRLLVTDGSSPNCLDKILDTALTGDLDFFEGCSIFVSGVDRNRQEKINRILDRCGAARVNAIERASHIVVAAVKERDRTSFIDAQKSNVIVLRPEWLVACIERKELVCTADYIWDADSTLQRAGTAASASLVVDSRQSINSSKLPPNEAMPFSNIITTVSDQLRLSGEVNAANSTFSVNNVFLDKSFRLHLLDYDLIPQLKSIIEENAGWTLEEDVDVIADYLVGGQIEFGSVPEQTTEKYKHLVTENFVRHCVRSKRLYDPHERPLFKPLPAVNGSQIFKDTVFGFVALGDIDKFTFGHLVRDFGGTIEASIVTRARDGIKPCTHIIAGEDSPKITEFRNKLPHMKIVDPSWIIDCIINDIKVQESKYLFKSRAYDCYKGRTDDFWLSRLSSTGKSCRTESTLCLEAPRDGISAHRDCNMELEFDEPLHFQKCTTSTPKGQQQYRRSMDSRFNPRIQIDGMTQILNEIPSPVTTEEETLNSLSITSVGKMLSEAAVKMGKTPTEPQRSVTEPASTSKKKEEFYRTTPKRAATSRQIKQIYPKVDISDEAAKNSRLMQRQMDYLFAQLKKEPEENGRPGADPSQGPKRKRGHEMIQDSPFAPPPKKNTSVLEPAVDWHPGQDQTDEICVVEQLGQENSIVITNGDPTVLEINDDSLVDPPPIIENRTRPSQHSRNSENVTVNKTPTKQRIPLSKSSGGKAKDSIEKLPMFSAECQKTFMFTGIGHVKDKEDFEKFVLDLGGQITHEEQECFSEVTHLVCGRLVRGTKLMGCIASGKWILKPNYLLDSMAVEKFLPEAQYEWGNPTVLANSELEEKEMQTARAAYRWRVKLRNNHQKGVFSGWKVLLYCAREKVAGVVPLLLSGDAEVITREQLQTSIAAYKPTHTVVIKSPIWNLSELAEVVAAGSRVFALDYIAKLLLEEKVDEKECYHPDYKAWARNVDTGI